SRLWFGVGSWRRSAAFFCWSAGRRRGAERGMFPRGPTRGSAAAARRRRGSGGGGGGGDPSRPKFGQNPPNVLETPRRRPSAHVKPGSMRVLVTGGAGYIGSHAVKALRERGHAPVVVDNLSRGHRAAVPRDVRLYELDVRQTDELTSVLREERIDC